MWQHNVVLNDSSENSSSIENCQMINLNTQMDVEIPTNENIKMRSKIRNVSQLFCSNKSSFNFIKINNTIDLLLSKTN